ncbi:hypothetical protein ACFL5U_02250 [Candidatus Margulisiibacteriota bacterium]
MDLIIVANSPGELSALVKPVAETASLNHRITLVLTPCQYISGHEEEYVKSLKGITNFVSAKGYKNWILRNQKPNIEFSKKGVVLYLGGDLAHAMLVAKKVGYPAYAYVQDFVGWKKFYKKFFIPDEQSAKKLKLKDKFSIVGNLMTDSVADLPKWNPQPNVITFLPGSRAWQIKHMTPIYEKIMSNVQSLMSNVEFQLVSSPFEDAIPIEGAKIIKFEEAYNSELVITIPGTNTARLAALGIPMISIFPLDNPDVIPLEGLLHYITSIPYFGSKIKKYFVDITNKQTKFFTLPNIKADREIVEEIRGVINPAEVAQKAVTLLKDKAKRGRMSEELVTAMGTPGAAAKIVEELREAL